MQVPEDCAGSSSGTSPKRDSFAFPSAVSSQDQGAVARVSGGGATFRASHVKHSIARTPLAAQKKPDNANMALQAILASSSRPPLTSSIPSPSGHRAHSELLQKVQQTLRPALARPETKPVAESVAQKQPNVPLPFLEPCPSLLRLVPVRKDREPLEHATNVPSPHDGEYSLRPDPGVLRLSCSVASMHACHPAVQLKMMLLCCSLQVLPQRAGSGFSTASPLASRRLVSHGTKRPSMKGCLQATSMSTRCYGHGRKTCACLSLQALRTATYSSMACSRTMLKFFTSRKWPGLMVPKQLHGSAFYFMEVCVCCTAP